MDEVFSTTIEKINNLPKPILIGISGFGGSGKSTIALALGEKLKAPVVGVDAFCKSTTQEDYEYWSVMDFNRLKEEVLSPFTQGDQEITYGNFNWTTNSLEEKRTLHHNGIVIVEGVGLFRPELMKFFSLTIWIDCPIEEAIVRGKKRDREEYHHPQDEYWNGIWKKNDLQCFEEFLPKKNADIVINHAKLGEISIVYEAKKLK